MDPQAQTSFIPKRPLADERPLPRQSSVSVFSLLATILFIASVAGAGMVYFYEKNLTTSVASKKGDLVKAKDAFEDTFLQELQSVDKRITAAQDVLQNHIVVSPLFTALQQLTLRSVQFTKFVYAIDGAGPAANVQVRMSGKAQGYTALALQSDELTKNKYIRDPIFSNLTLDDQGNVLFDLSFSVDPKFVLYGEALARVPAAPQSNTPTPVPTGDAITN